MPTINIVLRVTAGGRFIDGAMPIGEKREILEDIVDNFVAGMTYQEYITEEVENSLLPRIRAIAPGASIREGEFGYRIEAVGNQQGFSIVARAIIHVDKPDAFTNQQTNEIQVLFRDRADRMAENIRLSEQFDGEDVSEEGLDEFTDFGHVAVEVNDAPLNAPAVVAPPVAPNAAGGGGGAVPPVAPQGNIPLAGGRRRRGRRVATKKRRSATRKNKRSTTKRRVATKKHRASKKTRKSSKKSRSTKNKCRG